MAALESRAAGLQAAHEAAVRRADAAAQREHELMEELRAKATELDILTRESSEATTSFAAQLQNLREALAEAQARTAGLTDDLAVERAQNRAQEEEAEKAAAGGAQPGVRRHSTDGSNGAAAGEAQKGGGLGRTTSVMTPKWQVQNKVGSGSLYNLSSEHTSGAAGGAAAGKGPALSQPVDTVYMKNVLLKFLEAHLCNKVQERDVLLPAVATLLQATQEEFATLQKIMRATAPPSRQMLSVFGLAR